MRHRLKLETLSLPVSLFFFFFLASSKQGCATPTFPYKKKKKKRMGILSDGVGGVAGQWPLVVAVRLFRGDKCTLLALFISLLRSLPVSCCGEYFLLFFLCPPRREPFGINAFIKGTLTRRRSGSA